VENKLRNVYFYLGGFLPTYFPLEISINIPAEEEDFLEASQRIAYLHTYLTTITTVEAWHKQISIACPDFRDADGSTLL